MAALMDWPTGDAIVCGVSAPAAGVAIALAGRAHRRVIVVDPLGPVPPDAVATNLPRRLDVPLPASGVDVRTRVMPSASLPEIAREEHAALIVIGAEARRHRGLLRTFPVRLALRTTAPVLVIREGKSIRRWLDREITLRVMVAIDRSAAAKTALEWASAFAGDLPNEVVAAGLDPPMKPRDWDAAGAVLEIATKWQADLLVVGSRSARPLKGWWHRSPAERLIDEAPMNVAAVPCGSS
ncbi:MAG TPA: universal stress protein [Thermoanaerobaculia bacterium]|nr:universal stress protein [Thermoanaerobaculia bacterium]